MNKIYIIYYFLIIVLILKFIRTSENLGDKEFSKTNENYLLNKFSSDIESLKNLSNISKDIYNDGVLTIHGGLDITARLNILPKGIIVAWNKKEIPDGWAICDGNNGTPNLINKFLLGKSSETSLSKTGGEETVKLTLAHLPKHSHSTSISSSGNHSHSLKKSQNTFNHSSYTRNFCSPRDGNYACSVDSRRVTSFDITSSASISRLSSISSKKNGVHYHTVKTGLTGGSQSHNNMPPFHSLIWIMKL